jgi:hypothetical protein
MLTAFETFWFLRLRQKVFTDMIGQTTIEAVPLPLLAFSAFTISVSSQLRSQSFLTAPRPFFLVS